MLNIVNQLTIQANYTFYSIAMVSNFLPKLSKFIGIPISIVGIEIPKTDYFWVC
jgi:hypothetical protein